MEKKLLLWTALLYIKKMSYIIASMFFRNCCLSVIISKVQMYVSKHTSAPVVLLETSNVKYTYFEMLSLMFHPYVICLCFFIDSIQTNRRKYSMNLWKSLSIPIRLRIAFVYDSTDKYFKLLRLISRDIMQFPVFYFCVYYNVDASF